MFRGRENVIQVNITKQDKGQLSMPNNLIILIAAVERKCYNTISEQARKNIFWVFLENWNIFCTNALICGLLKQETPKRGRPITNTKKRKKTTNSFFTVNGKSKVVCSLFFSFPSKLVSDGRMTRALNKVNTGEPPGDDKWGKKVPASKTPDQKMELVRGHISSFPSYQSHYTRTITQADSACRKI